MNLQATFLWVFKAIDSSGEHRGDIEVGSALVGQSADQQLAEVSRVQKWLKGLPSSRRVLVKVLLPLKKLIHKFITLAL